MRTAFRSFPAVSLPDTTPDAIGFFEAITLAGVEKQYVRISAATQRRHFGCVPFGKLAVRVENNVCRTLRSQCFGTDFDIQEAYWSMADKAWLSTHDNTRFSSFPR